MCYYGCVAQGNVPMRTPAYAILCAVLLPGFGAGCEQHPDDHTWYIKIENPSLGSVRGVCVGNRDECEVSADIPERSPELSYGIPEEIYSKLKQANFMYNRVLRAQRGDAFDVVLRVFPSSDTVSSIPDVYGGADVSLALKITPKLSAELTGGSNFVVEPAGTRQKLYSEQAPVSWSWTVKAMRDGSAQLLTMTIYAHDSDGEPVAIGLYEDQVDVDLSFYQMAEDFVLALKPIWLLLGTVVPTALAILAWLRSRWRSQGKANQAREGLS